MGVYYDIKAQYIIYNAYSYILNSSFLNELSTSRQNVVLHHFCSEQFLKQEKKIFPLIENLYLLLSGMLPLDAYSHGQKKVHLLSIVKPEGFYISGHNRKKKD